MTAHPAHRAGLMGLATSGTSPAIGARRPRWWAALPGLAVALAVSGGCLALTQMWPTIPALLVAILVGAAARTCQVLPAALEPGLAWTARRVLRIGVVLLGLQLSVGDLLRLGGGEVLVLVVTVMVTFASTLWLGKLLRVGPGLRLLVATGFSICGAAAAAAMAPVADAEDEDLATAVAMVTVYGSAAIVVVPVLAGAFGLDDRTAGLWAGLSVHEVAQVVAAAGTVSAAALTVAVVSKLARVLLLAPLVAGVGVWKRRSASRAGQEAGRKVAGRRPAVVPLFVVGFLVAVLARTVGLVPEGAVPLVKSVTTLALGAAMVALGTQIDVRRLVRTGGRPMLLGAAATVIVMGVSLAGLSLL